MVVFKNLYFPSLTNKGCRHTYGVWPSPLEKKMNARFLEYFNDLKES